MSRRTTFTYEELADYHRFQTPGFPQKGHLEEIPLTDEDRAEHARAVQAYEECMKNPWINLEGFDCEFYVKALAPMSKFVPEETDEEHMARWVEAGRPVVNLMQQMIEEASHALSRKLDAEILRGTQGDDA